jgi:hypothetical protein
MKTLRVVIRRHIFTDISNRFLPGSIQTVTGPFPFQAAEEPFYRRVAPAVTLPRSRSQTQCLSATCVTSALGTAWETHNPLVEGSSPSRPTTRPASPGWGSVESYQIQKATPKDGRCMSEFGDRADVQQIRVITVVMITVLRLPAKTCRSRIHKNSELWEIIIGSNRLRRAN